MEEVITLNNEEGLTRLGNPYGGGPLAPIDIFCLNFNTLCTKYKVVASERFSLTLYVTDSVCD